MRETGIDRYWKKVNRVSRHGMETQHPVGRRLLTESVSLLSEAIREWKRTVTLKPVGQRSAAYPYIDLLATDLIAAITARSVIDSISMHEKITKIAFKVARMIEDEVRWRDLKAKEPDLWRDQMKLVKRIPGYTTKRRFLANTEKFTDQNFARWPRTERLKVGMTLVELMKQSTGIVEITTRTGLLGKRETYVHATEALLEWMKGAHNYAEDLSPTFLPLVERPADWTDVYTGGYLTEYVHPRPLVKTRDKTHLDELNALDIFEPKASVNRLQRVSWIINANVYDPMAYCWENEIEVGGLPSANGQEIPSKPVDIETNAEARRKWRKLAARIRFENKAEASKRLQITKILWMAKKFINEEIFFPWYMDFRGRKYPRVYFMQPQGSDEARSMLMFAQGKAIESDEGERWLTIHGANCWGEDKVSLDDRVQWVHANRDMVEAVGNDPLGTTSIWGKADKPWAFLAWCADFTAFLRFGRGYVSHLPISIDGSSNGLQLYSLLMRDPIGAAATNVLPNAFPRDIYQDVADGTIRRLKESDNPMAPIWLEFGVGRAVAKRPTMVVPYSGSLHSCITYTIDWFNEDRKKRKIENPFGWEEVFKPCAFLARQIWDSIGDVVGEARKAMAWLQEISNTCIANEVPLRWTTPSGFMVKQAYETWHGQSVRTIIGDVIRQHRVRVGTGKLAKVKNRNGIAPNMIHSIDAAIGDLTILRNSSQGMTSQCSIHDAYLCLAEDMPMMRRNVLDSVVEIFTEDLMQKFLEEITYYLPMEVTLPEPPQRGDLDIQLVRESEYFFS